MWSRLLANPVIHATLIFLLIVFISLFFAWLLSPVLLPLIISSILYLFLKPVIITLEGRSMPDNLAITLVIAILSVAIIGSFVILLPLLFDQLQDLQGRLPSLWQKISVFVNQISEQVNEITGVTYDANAMLQSVLKNIEETGATLVISSAAIMMQFLMVVILAPLITYFLLRDFHVMRNRIMSWLPNQSFELGWIIYHAVVCQLQDYLRGIMLQSIIIAIIASFGFYLVGVEMYFLFGVTTGLLNLVPYVGPLLAVIPPLIVSLGGEGVTTFTLIGIPAVVLCAQLLDNVLVVPTVIAHSVNLHPLVVLLGIIIFGAFFGFIGMLIAIPLIAISKIIFTSLLYGLNEQESFYNK